MNYTTVGWLIESVGRRRSLKTARLHIRRTDEHGADIGFKTYNIPYEPRDTVLHALKYIYSTVDSTLAFRYSCRFKKCGLCGVRISGRSRLACLTRLEDEMTVEPLSNLPVIRDLVVDRRQLLDQLRDLNLFPVTEETVDKPLEIPDRHYRLSVCLECLCCHSECAALKDGAGFAGPFTLVKLSQMQSHPQDSYDRRQQAKVLGIENCLSCQGCSCPYGINISSDVVTPLLSKIIPPSTV